MDEIAKQIRVEFKDDMQFHRFFERLIVAIHDKCGGLTITQTEYFKSFGHSELEARSIKDDFGVDSEVFDSIPESYLEFLVKMRGVIDHMILMEAEDCEGKSITKN